MIPLAIVQDGETVNLSQIVRLRVVRPDSDPNGGEVEVFFSDGIKRIYTGNAARFLNIEMHFALNLYRRMQIEVTNGGSGLVTPDGTPAGGRVM